MNKGIIKLLVSQFGPQVLELISPFEADMISILKNEKLDPGESEIVGLIKVENNNFHLIPFAVNENLELVRQVTIKNKKTFKIKDLIENMFKKFK